MLRFSYTYMSEIPAPEEVISEATKPDSPESSTPESGKNHDIGKFFEDFHASPEYQKELEKRSRELEHRISRGPFSEEEKRELLVAGYEGGRVFVGDREFNFESGDHEYYKEAFMRYVERFYDETETWPLYFSPQAQNEDVTVAYENYKEKAQAVWAYINHGKSSIQTMELDKVRSDAHDRLASLLYQAGNVKTLLDGKLVARMWLVADGVEGPGGITFMDKSRKLRSLQYMQNLEILGSRKS